MRGSSFGFLYHNFYPAKIFLGDGGSYLLGSLIAFFCIFSHNYFLNNNIPQFSFLWQFLILIIPITDINYVFFSRIFEGISPFYPDRRHFHFKIQNYGFTHKETVILFYLISLLFSAIVFANLYGENIIYLSLVPIFTLFLIFVLKKEKTVVLVKKIFNLFKSN